MFFTAPRAIPKPPVDGLSSTHPRQVEFNESIKQRLAGEDEEGKERVIDALHFARWIQPNLPGINLGVSSAPVLFLTDADSRFEITLNHGSASFSVKDSHVATSASEGERLSITRDLNKQWDTLIAHLPEGFIIYGPDTDLNHPSFAMREQLLQGLGFAPVEANGDRMAIVRGGKLAPLTAFEYKELTGQEEPAYLYNQRLCVERIVWDNEEVA